MEPLIKITNVPIAFEMKVNNAHLEYKNGTADLEIQRYAQAGKTAAYEATASMAQNGRLMLKAKIGDDVLGNIIKENTDKYFQMKDFNVEFIPDTMAELSWSQPDVTIDYQMDKLNFDWRIFKGDFEFVPGNIEFNITQQPDVIIEYIGGPIYVPPSSDPNYEPIDVKA